MRYFHLTVFILTHLVLTAQISDDFSDGNFSVDPTWTGTSADYTVNANLQLQLNNSIASVSYLSTPHNLSNLDDKEWRVYTRQAFSPSGSNNGRIYLTAASADLTIDPDGFFLQLGESGSGDAVRLFKREAGIEAELIAGSAGQIAASFELAIRVLRDNLGNWSLYLDESGGTSYSLVGTTNDPTNLLGTHLGFVDSYTVSNATNFYHDDVYAGDIIVDSTPPILLTAEAVNANAVDVYFDEPLDPISAQNGANYSFVPAQSVAGASLDASDPALVHLNLLNALTNGVTYTLTASSVADVALNVSGGQSVNFAYLVGETPAFGDLIINEFMCDPSPVVGLAEAEFVEVYNRSNKIFNLDNWTLGDASSAGMIQEAWLMPGEYLVLTATANVDSFSIATSVTNFPSLNNSGDQIILSDSLGQVIDSLMYTDDWYKDPNKSEGGYSIERINPGDPCAGADDWAASTAPLGGTPGLQNAVFDNTPDTLPPDIGEVLALPPNYLEIHFSEGMDSLSLATALVSTNPSLTVQNVFVPGRYPTMFTVQFVENLISSQVYSISLQDVADCWLNTASVNAQFVLTELTEPGDVVINEIMFNPLTGGSDWVELYNNSEKVVDLYGWELANFDNDTINNHAAVSSHALLFPGDFVVLAEDSLQVIQNYPHHGLGSFVQLDLPTYTNDSSTVYVIAQQQLVDKVSYNEKWHFGLLDDLKGKSLERLDPDGSSSNEHNWHTAAETIGFATPGLENSQFYPALIAGDFDFSSETISPDSDGFEDVLQVHYEMAAPGMIADFTIYDDRGRKVATVLRAAMLASSGSFIWDGTTDENHKASIGAYIAVFEAFDPNGGKVFVKRKAFVVAGRL